MSALVSCTRDTGGEARLAGDCCGAAITVLHTYWLLSDLKNMCS